MGNPKVATYFLITLMQAGPDDHQKPYRMTTEAAHADGTSRFLAEATISVDAQIGENRFIVQRFGVNTEMSGRNMLIQTIDGGGSNVVLYSSPNLPNAKPAAQHWFSIVNPPKNDD